MAADKGEVKLEKFDGKDFGFWKMQIEDYLYQKKLYQPLEEKKPDGMQEAEWKLLDRQALGVIRLTLSRNVAFNIAKETTTAGLMKALSNMYEKPSASNKVHLMRRLFSLRMSEGGSVAQHLNELNFVTTQLSSVEIKFDDEVLALILLSSLPDSWNATVTAVSSSSGNNKLKFDDVRDLVLSEEIRRRESGESSSSSVLHTESRGRNLIRRNERGRSNYRGQSRDRRSKSRNPNNFQNSKTVECWNCGKIGHYKNQCKGTPKGKEVKAEANVTSTKEGDDALICSLESKEESWVYLGDDQPCDIVGQGNVKIKLNGSAWELKDVKHVPDLRKNLISVGQLAREGSDMNDIIKLKHQLSKEFDMKDLGPPKKILGMQITRDKQRGTLQLSQSEYIKRVLQRFNMGDAKPIRDIFNGLILFQEFRAPYYEFTRFPVLKLWNPSARKHQILRPCPLTLPGDGVDNFAIGFDSSSKDYKVVAFGGYDNGVDNVKIAVYSFNNRRWKIKDVGVNNLVSSFSIRLHHRYFCQGAAHWINGDIVVEYDGSFEHTHMSSFDFGVEEFRRVPLPGWKMFKCLFDFGKSLAVFGISAESSKIWIMREDVGEVVPEKPWVRCFKGGSSLDALKFFIGNRNARITYDEYSGVYFLLSWRDSPVRLMSYDVTSQKIETIRRNYGYRICCADAYVESWVTCSASILQNVD
uniref:CCHC-type domain-containing protein n=1 Tax=Chenopodium quinoa TaxID=63459 RepID=A0A803MP45_CHEQI